MESSGKAFNEVRALLSKMDRSIDEARTKRLGPPIGTPAPTVAKAGTTTPVDLDQEVGGTTPTRPLTELQRKRASFGRAKPLGRNDAPGQWKSSNTDDTVG